MTEAEAAGALDPRWTAVVLAGGRGSRLGDVAKPQIVVAGRTLLSRVVDAIPADVRVVVVGPQQAAPRPVVFRREDPPFGGPVAALAAALEVVQTEAVGLVGADMPAAGPVLVELADRWDREQALVPVDVHGHRQHLCSVLAAVAVRRALDDVGDVTGCSLRALLARLDVVEVRLDAGRSALLCDVDEPADLAALRLR